MYAYRDKLIGTSNIEITRGQSNGYVWSVRTIDNRLDIDIHKGVTRVCVDKAPNYVMADIARVMALGSNASIAANTYL